MHEGHECQEHIARAIATIAHRGQVDKAGRPYIEHPARVVEHLDPQGDSQWRLRAAAWLHDVIEDTDISGEELVTAGVHPDVVADVELLTRRSDVPDEEYYAAIARSTTARAVKLADIADNTDPERFALLDQETASRLSEKYTKARARLGS